MSGPKNNKGVATIDKLRSGLGHARDHKDISPVLAEIGKLTPIFGRLESMGMTANFVVRLRTTQDVLRRSMLRIFQTQRGHPAATQPPNGHDAVMAPKGTDLGSGPIECDLYAVFNPTRILLRYVAHIVRAKKP